MKSKFNGKFSELKAIINNSGIPGKWSVSGADGKETFRTPAGGILNWWRNGTINFQGNDFAKGALERTLQALLSGSCNSEPSNTSNAKHEGDTQHVAEPVAANQPQSRLRNCCDAPSLLKRVKDTLTKSGLTVMLVNDTTYIVRETAYDHYCSLDDKESEIYIREM